MTTDEIWESVQDFPHIFVSNRGRFKNSKSGRILRTATNGRGYPYIGFHVPELGYTKSYLAARIVAAHFSDTYKPGRRIYYIDRNPLNISADNLECRDVLSSDNRRDRPVRRHSKRVRIVELDKVFANAYTAARYVGGHSESVARVASGSQHTHMGYHFEYVSVGTALEYYRRDQDA